MDKAHVSIMLRLQHHGFIFKLHIYIKADLRNFIGVLGKNELVLFSVFLCTINRLN